MTEAYQITYFGNSLKSYAITLGIILLGILLLRLLRLLVLRRLHKLSERTETEIDDVIADMLSRGVLPLLYSILIYMAVKRLILSPFLERALNVAAAVVIVFFVVRILILGIRKLLEHYFKKQGRVEATNAMSGVMIIIQVVLWTLGLVFLLGNLGYDVGAILAGLGIGGIAIALAAQNILSDVFAYFSILFDRPYEVGEFLILEDHLGTVKHIGIKTTRIESLTGEELSYSNQNMLNAWIHNYSRMEKRRVVFGLNVSYDTPADTIERIPGEIKKIINAQNKVQLDRVHFAQFREYYLYFEAVYYSMEPGYGEFMDKQQKINIAICRKFEEMGVKFAFSGTRKVLLQPHGPDAELALQESRTE